MTDVIPFPGAVPAPEVRTERDENEVHAQAFRNLESEVCDLNRWAELARSLVLECACDRRSWRELELAVLVVERLSELVGDFRHGYYRAWKGAPEDCS